VDLGRFLRFLIQYTVGRTPWTGNELVARLVPTNRATQTQNKRTQTFMPQVGFEPTVPVLERVKRVHVFDRADTAIYNIYFNCKWVFTRWQWYYNKTQHTNNKTIKRNTEHKITYTINALHIISVYY
jgi:hypothetical protein